MGFGVSTLGVLETMDHILLWSETQNVLEHSCVTWNYT